MNELLPMNLQYFAEGDLAPINQGEENVTTDETVEVRTFTQDDVTRIAAKEAKQGQEKLLRELGVEDMESAKDGLAKYKEFLESQKTEQEKVTEELKVIASERDALNAQYGSLLAENSALKAGVTSENVTDVVALAQSYVKDDVTIEEAIKSVVEKYPNFLGKEETKEVDKPRLVNPAQPTSTEGTKSNPFKDAVNRITNK